MLPITFELPHRPVPLGILRERWAGIVARYPHEVGPVESEPSPLGADLVRITLQVPRRTDVYEQLLEALVQIDMWARETWRFPALYAGAVRYAPDVPGVELWATTPALFLRGSGDCEDLSADRVSERRLAGQYARPFLQLEQHTPETDFWHVAVELFGGVIEDPSRRLGMR